MAIQHAHYRFTRAEYHKMAEAGILHEDSRVELIEGEILEMSPIGRRHNGSVDRLTRVLVSNLGETAIVRVQGSVALAEGVEPEPDIAVLRPKADFYTIVEETAADVLLVVEVADSSEAYDRLTKAPMYARYAIPELWIVNLNRDQVVVYRDPKSTGYATTQVYRRGDSISPLAFPNLTIAIVSILG